MINYQALHRRELINVAKARYGDALGVYEMMDDEIRKELREYDRIAKILEAKRGGEK